MEPLSRATCGKGRPAVLILLAWATALGAGHAQDSAVQNEAGATVKVTGAEIAAMPHQKVSVDDHGKTVAFGKSLRGKRLSSCLVAEAADGYRVVIALPELDPGFTDRVILLADKADGHPLDTKEGPFRIVVPGEKRMARWVRQVTSFKVVPVQ